MKEGLLSRRNNIGETIKTYGNPQNGEYNSALAVELLDGLRMPRSTLLASFTDLLVSRSVD